MYIANCLYMGSEVSIIAKTELVLETLISSVADERGNGDIDVLEIIEDKDSNPAVHVKRAGDEIMDDKEMIKQRRRCRESERILLLELIRIRDFFKSLSTEHLAYAKTANAELREYLKSKSYAYEYAVERINKLVENEKDIIEGVGNNDNM